MSKFADKLQGLSKVSSAPIGFHSSVSEAKAPTMLLVVGLSGTQVKEFKTVTDVDADAGLILSGDAGAKFVKETVKAVGDVPVGVSVKGLNEKQMDELVGAGCDFFVFDMKIAAAVLQKGKVGKFLTIEPSLDQGLARAISSLEVDGHMNPWLRMLLTVSYPLFFILPSLALRVRPFSVLQTPWMQCSDIMMSGSVSAGSRREWMISSTLSPRESPGDSFSSILRRKGDFYRHMKP